MALSFEQILLASVFYFAVVLLFRIAGKRLAGQTTTFDLVILISLSVAIQKATLHDGLVNTLTFIFVVFAWHWVSVKVCARSQFVRQLLRGKPCMLVCNGEVLYRSLQAEGMTVDELEAGLRKAGFNDVKNVACAHLEETGQISVVSQPTKA